MTVPPMGLTAILLVSFAAIVCLLSCLGLTAMRGFYDRLHYLAPPAILGTAAVVGAIVVEEGLSSTGMKVLLILVVMLISNPVLTHAAARAHYLRTRNKGSADKEE